MIMFFKWLIWIEKIKVNIDIMFKLLMFNILIKFLIKMVGFKVRIVEKYRVFFVDYLCLL